MANDILTEKELSNSAYSHIIHAPIEKVDIAGWLFTLFFIAVPEELFFRGLMLNLLARWVPDAAVRKKILVDNPARLYGFEN